MMMDAFDATRLLGVVGLVYLAGAAFVPLLWRRRRVRRAAR